MKATTFFLFLFLSFSVQSQEVMMQGWYWDYPKTANGASFADTLFNRVTQLAQSGITKLWLPPLSRASFGSGSNGYDPKDLYDLGEYGLGATGFGTRTQVNDLITALNTSGIEAVADVVYNHRDGGQPEENNAVAGWIKNFSFSKVEQGDQPFPSDRVRFILPLGGTSGNGAGDYYFKIRSASGHPNFHNKGYKFYVQTNTKGFQNMAAIMESEPNGGGNCNFEPSNEVPLGVDMLANVDGTGCGIDEFKVTLTVDDFDAAGDFLYIFMNNTSGGYSDHYISELYSIPRGANIAGEIIYQTYTDFTNLPSGQGAMTYLNFKPNGNPTNLGGDWDAMLFFYDYDQSVTDTRDKLIDWTKWLWNDVGIRGLRMDAVKHFNPAFVGELLNASHVAGHDYGMVVGEFFDNDAGKLKGWVEGVEAGMSLEAQAAMDVKVFDFNLRASLEAASDAFGYDVRNVFESGIVDGVGGNSKNVVTFVNNHDYRGAGEPVDNDPLLGYAYILTNREVGLPTVFYPDYYGIQLPHGPSKPLRNDIDKLIEIYDDFMHGGQIDYLNNKNSPAAINYNSGFATTSLIYQSYGGGPNQDRDAIVVINYAGGNDILDVEFPVTSNSSKASGTIFRDLTGKALTPEVIQDGSNRVRVIVPPRSYAVFVDVAEHSGCSSSPIVFVDESAIGLNNGTSWGNAFTNLAAALSFGQLCPAIEEIQIKEGTYYPGVLDERDRSFRFNRNLKLIGGFPASIDNPTMEDRDAINYPTILSGEIGNIGLITDNAFHVIENYSTSEVMISGIIIESGNANGVGENQQKGSGILNNGTLFLEDVILRACNNINGGGFIHIGSGGLLRMEHCILEGVNGDNFVSREVGQER